MFPAFTVLKVSGWFRADGSAEAQGGCGARLWTAVRGPRWDRTREEGAQALVPVLGVWAHRGQWGAGGSSARSWCQVLVSVPRFRR